MAPLRGWRRTPHTWPRSQTASRHHVEHIRAGNVTPSPPHPAEPFWPPIHGEARVSLPALTEFLVLLLARGRLFELSTLAREPLAHTQQDGPLAWLYQQLFVAPDTEKGRRLAALAREAITERGGRWALSWNPASLGIVTWRPRA